MCLLRLRCVYYDNTDPVPWPGTGQIFQKSIPGYLAKRQEL